MAKRRTSRRRRSRPARRNTRRRTSKRRSPKRKLKIYLYYRTPGGQKKLKSLGSGSAARAAYKNWRSKVRGRGYRTLKKISAYSLAEARRCVTPSARRTSRGRKRRRKRA